jgi:hypothetical protein
MLVGMLGDNRETRRNTLFIVPLGSSGGPSLLAESRPRLRVPLATGIDSVILVTERPGWELYDKEEVEDRERKTVSGEDDGEVDEWMGEREKEQ